ncbi:MAG: LuxR family transcriptional regulator [Eggerthellaceae bacterium]|nr:LuxR family transcriptional regulator [Eggerthellaceae bacterium]MCH4221563.1 LuxR family transcriptional regulator [Eggerthellaceae bacterium]
MDTACTWMEKYFPSVFTHFRIAYLGLLAPQVWVYCVLQRADIGESVIPLSSTIYASIGLGMIFFSLFRHVTSDRSEHLLSWPATVMTSIATIPLVAPLSLGTPTMEVWAIIGGIGVGWMLLSWAPFYAYLDIRNAVACIFAVMAFGCAIEAVVDLAPDWVAAMILTIIPFYSVVSRDSADKHRPTITQSKRIYFGSLKTTSPWLILLGVGVYGCILGIIPGVAGSPDAVSRWETVLVQHGLEIVAACATLWWVFCFHGALHFSNMWRAILVLTATGLFFLPLLSPFWAEWSLVLIAIAHTLMLMLLWALVADVAHHSDLSPFLILGGTWCAFTLPLAVGQIAGPILACAQTSQYLVTTLTYALTLTAVFALNDRNLM